MTQYLIVSLRNDCFSGLLSLVTPRPGPVYIYGPRAKIKLRALPAGMPQLTTKIECRILHTKYKRREIRKTPAFSGPFGMVGPHAVHKLEQT